MLIFGSDHAGYALKNELIDYVNDKNIEYIDAGCGGEAVDYPDIVLSVCREVLKNTGSFGVICCGTGIGVSMAANKINGIRAALCTDSYMAEYTRRHNDANVLCLGGRVTGAGSAANILESFLAAKFEGGKHSVRVEKIMKLENYSYKSYKGDK